MRAKNIKGILFALLAAVLYAFSTPFSKLLLKDTPATLLAGLLYIGAGAGMWLMGAVRRASGAKRPDRFEKDDIVFLVGMVLLDIAAPICLL